MLGKCQGVYKPHFHGHYRYLNCKIKNKKYSKHTGNIRNIVFCHGEPYTVVRIVTKVQKVMLVLVNSRQCNPKHVSVRSSSAPQIFLSCEFIGVDDSSQV